MRERRSSMIQPGTLRGDAGRPHELVQLGHVAGAQPRVEVRDGGVEHDALDVEVASAGGPSGAVGDRASASSSDRPRRHGDRAQRGEVDLAEVVIPVDLVDVEAEGLAVDGVQPSSSARVLRSSKTQSSAP